MRRRRSQSVHWLAPPGKLAARVKDGGVGVSLTTQALQRLLPPISSPPLRSPAVSEWRAVRGQDGRGAGRCRWLGGGRCYRSLVVWSASSASWEGNPARGSPRQFRALKSLNMARAAAARRCLESTTETAAPSPRGDDVQVIGGGLVLKKRSWQIVELLVIMFFFCEVRRVDLF